MRPSALSRVLISVIAVLSGSAAAADAELQNPSVEERSAGEASLPAGWTPNMWGTVVASFGFATPGKDGERGLRIDVHAAGPPDTGDAKWMSDPWTLPLGPASERGAALYAVSDWYRADVPTALLVQLNDGAGRSEWATVARVAPAATWTPARGTVAVPAWVITMRVVHVIAAPGWLETDAFAASLSPDGEQAPGAPKDAAAPDVAEHHHDAGRDGTGEHADGYAPPSRESVDAQTYASYRTMPRAQEHEPVGCALATTGRAGDSRDRRGLIALALAATFIGRRRSR